MTIPTIITQDQYNNAMLAVDLATGDHWLFWATDGSTEYDEHLWLCRMKSALDEPYEGLEWLEVKNLSVTDENGDDVEIEALTFKAHQLHVNGLSLESLAEGEVNWF